MDNSLIKYRIAGIELVYKTLNPLPTATPINQLVFDLRVEMRINADLKLVIPYVTVSIKTEQEKVELASMGVSCLFEIEDFEKHIIKNAEGLFIIPESFEFLIRPIAISTTRGVMFAEFRGTYLNNAILPIVNTNPTT